MSQRILGLKPTHRDSRYHHMEYVCHNGKWLFICPLSYEKDSDSWEWAESSEKIGDPFGPILETIPERRA